MFEGFQDEGHCYLKVSNKQYDSGIFYKKYSFFNVPNKLENKKDEKSTEMKLSGLKKRDSALKMILQRMV